MVYRNCSQFEKALQDVSKRIEDTPGDTEDVPLQEWLQRRVKQLQNFTTNQLPPNFSPQKWFQVQVCFRM